MKPKAIAVYLAMAAFALAAAPSAFAETATIGSVKPPEFAYAEACSGRLAWQTASVTAPSFAVPAEGAAILAWQTNVKEADEAGATETFVVLRPTASGKFESRAYEVLGADTETLPTPTPSEEVASFTLAKPIPVQPGDVLGLYGASSNTICAYGGAGMSEGETTAWRSFGSAPLASEEFNPETGAGVNYERVNVAATVALRPVDLGVSTAVAPANAIPGQAVSLTSLLTDHDATGADGEDVVTDEVPAGLTISAAAVGNGVCDVEGQRVTCTVARLGPGESVPLLIAAQAGAAGAYVNKVSAVGGRSDQNPANDHAEATLTVAAPEVPSAPAAPQPACTVPRLRTLTLAAAKHVLRALGCKPGNVRKQSSSKVAKGAVLSTAPGPGSYAAATPVAIVVSSGRAHAPHHASGAKHGNAHGAKHNSNRANHSSHGAKHNSNRAKHNSYGAHHEDKRGRAKGKSKRHHPTHASAASRIDQRMLT